MFYAGSYAERGRSYQQPAAEALFPGVFVSSASAISAPGKYHPLLWSQRWGWGGVYRCILSARCGCLLGSVLQMSSPSVSLRLSVSRANLLKCVCLIRKMVPQPPLGPYFSEQYSPTHCQRQKTGFFFLKVVGMCGRYLFSTPGIRPALPDRVSVNILAVSHLDCRAAS